MAATLQDLGEFAILDRLLGSSGRELGDDCFHFPIGDTLLAITADPGPAPLTRLLGRDWDDMEVWGWYAALASASDLATVGATPLFMTNCVLAPADMPASALERYFSGFRRALEVFGFTHAGGDLNSASSFRSICTAVGSVPAGHSIGRGGCKPGHRIACVGHCGAFAAAFLDAVRTPRADLSDDIVEVLTRPSPRMREIRTLRSVIDISAASDASDGLLAAISNISRKSNCHFSLTLCKDMITEEVQRAGRSSAINPWALFSFWGDWQVVFTFPQHAEELVVSTARSMEMPLLILGSAVEGPPGITACVDGATFAIEPLRNEHFSSTSYLFAGVNDVINMMNRTVFIPL